MDKSHRFLPCALLFLSFILLGKDGFQNANKNKALKSVIDHSGMSVHTHMQQCLNHTILQLFGKQNIISHLPPPVYTMQIAELSRCCVLHGMISRGSTRIQNKGDGGHRLPYLQLTFSLSKSWGQYLFPSFIFQR